MVLEIAPYTLPALEAIQKLYTDLMAESNRYFSALAAGFGGKVRGRTMDPSRSEKQPMASTGYVRVSCDKQDLFAYLPSSLPLLASHYWVTLEVPFSDRGPRKLRRKSLQAAKVMREYEITEKALQSTDINVTGIDMPPTPDVDKQWALAFFDKQVKLKKELVDHGKSVSKNRLRHGLKDYISRVSELPEYAHIIKILQDHPDDDFKLRHIISLATAGNHCDWRSDNQTTDTYRELTDQWEVGDLDAQLYYWLNKFKLACLYQTAGQTSGPESTSGPTQYAKALRGAGLALPDHPGVTESGVAVEEISMAYLNHFNPYTLMTHMKRRVNTLLKPPEENDLDRNWIDFSKQVRNALLSWVEVNGLSGAEKEHLNRIQQEHSRRLQALDGKGLQQENQSYRRQRHAILEENLENQALLKWDDDATSFQLSSKGVVCLLDQVGILGSTEARKDERFW